MKKILLIDDDINNSMMLKRFIEDEGYEVAYAPNGEYGLQLYRDVHPDLILLDINMPGINGFELAKIIRDENRRVLIFFLTDRTDKIDRLYGFKLKGNDYIPKPFYPEELMAKIRERFDSNLTSKDEEYRFGATVFRPNTASLIYKGETHALSVRQTEILSILAENLGKTVDRESILNSVWGDSSYANSLALNVQITYLRKLLEDPTIKILSIKKKGYILKECNPDGSD